MSERDLLPRRPYAALPPEPGGFEAALARGRQRRRRTAGSSVLASAVAVVLAMALNAPNPDGAARLEFTERPETGVTQERELSGPADDAVDVDPLELDAPAQPARADGGRTGAADLGEGGGSDAAATVDTPKPRSTPPRTSSGGRRLSPPKEYHVPGGYPTCATTSSNTVRVNEKWCLVARYYADTGNGELGSDSRFAIDVCRAVDTAAGVLSFPTEQLVDFEIRAAGADELIWQWSHRAVFYAKSSSDRVAAGDCRSYEVPWGDLDNSGLLADPGQYTLTATTFATELRTGNRATVDFTYTPRNGSG